MNENKKPTARKTGSILTKSIIILVVLVAVISVSMWAWFSNKTDATATGLTVSTKADGVEISWDGVNYYRDLTARSEDEISDFVGYAKNITGSADPYFLRLVTGNGTEFFEPFINRRTGEIVTENDVWQGTVITPAKSAGKYIDIDLYFRSTEERTIYLAGDSKVSPKNPQGNYSDYGAFSKDYIAAASRIAFLNAEKNQCNWIWAPNSDIVLSESEGGYTKLQKVTDVIETGSGAEIPDEILENEYNSNFYLWLPENYIVDDSASQGGMIKASDFQFEYVKTIDGQRKGLFVTTVNLIDYGRNESIPFIINENASAVDVNDIDSYMYNYKDGQIDKTADDYNDQSDSRPIVKFSNGTYTVTLNGSSKDTCCINVDGFGSGSTVEVKIGYNRTDKKFIILEYSGAGKDYVRGGDQTTEISYYSVPETEILALASEGTEMTVSSNVNLKTDVTFNESGSINPARVSSYEQFTAHLSSGEKNTATYKFKNKKNSTYLKADGTGVSFVGVDDATEFSLVDLPGVGGPVLTANGSYLVYANNKFSLVSAAAVTSQNYISVYKGTSYELLTGMLDTQTYEYYNNTSQSLVTLNDASVPKLFTSSASTAANSRIGEKIVELTKANESDEYYTAHIVLRVWVEGTDREALIPLADGLFDLSLHFVS